MKPFQGTVVRSAVARANTVNPPKRERTTASVPAPRRNRTLPAAVPQALDLDVVDAYLRRLSKKTSSTATIATYEGILKHFARFAPTLLNGPTSWEEVEPHHIEAFHERPRRSGGNGTPQSIRTEYAIITELYKYLVEFNYVDTTPMGNVAIPPIRSVDGSSKALSDAVFTTVWRAQLGQNDRFWIGLAAICGLRVSEICSIRPREVDLSNGVILNLTRKGSKIMGLPYRDLAYLLEEELPKVYKGASEWVDLFEWFVRQRVSDSRVTWLTPYDSAATGKERRAHGKLDTELWGPIPTADDPSPKGAWPAPRKMNQVLDYILKDLGIGPEERFTPHAFRHTACTNMLRAKMDLQFVAQIMGHDRLETTKLYDKTEYRLMEMLEQRRAARSSSTPKRKRAR